MAVVQEQTDESFPIGHRPTAARAHVWLCLDRKTRLNVATKYLNNSPEDLLYHSRVKSGEIIAQR